MVGRISFRRNVVDLSIESPGVETILLDPSQPRKRDEMATGFFRRRSRRNKKANERRLSDMSNQFALLSPACPAERARTDVHGQPSVAVTNKPKQRASILAGRRLLDCDGALSTNHQTRHAVLDEPQTLSYPACRADTTSQRAAPALPSSSSSSSALRRPSLSHVAAAAWMQMGGSARQESVRQPRRDAMRTCPPGQQDSSLSLSSSCSPPNPSSVCVSFDAPRSLTTATHHGPSHSGSHRPTGSVPHHAKPRKQPMSHDWKSAVDPKSGRTYYYNTKTRDTQWRKPVEMATPEELHAMELKERKQKEFFAAMEANILKSMQRASVTSSSTCPDQSTATTTATNRMDGLETTATGISRADTEARKSTGSLSSDKIDESGLLVERPTHRVVRTISGMDDTILKEIVERQPSCRAIPVEDSNEITSKAQSAERQGSFTIDALVQSEPSLRKLEETVLENTASTADFTSSSLDFNMSSTNFMDMANESSMHLGLSVEESQALQKVARTAQTMRRLSEIPSEGAAWDYSSSDDDQETYKRPSLQPTGPSSPDGPLPSTLTPKQEAALASSDLKRLSLGKRRNSCGTMYVGSTLSAPDSDATIKCVCGVYRAHILSAAQEEPDSVTRGEYRLFMDRSWDRERRGSPAGRDELMLMRLSLRSKQKAPQVPSLDEISAFYRNVFRKAQMETDTIIMSLIYVERLIKSSHGALRPRSDNWRSLLFSCMILSSKVWDDLSMWNVDFSQTCPKEVKFSLQRINELEVAVLTALNYIVKVPPSEYSKYYFYLRAMLIKSGLGGDNLHQMSPLDVQGAKRLEQVSSTFQSMASTKRKMELDNLSRSKSVGISEIERLRKARSERYNSQEVKASLEHVVKMSRS